MQYSARRWLMSLVLAVTGATVPAVAQKVPDRWLDRDPAPASPRQPQIVAAGAAVFVVWVSDRGGGRNIYFNRSLDRGDTWLPVDRRLNTEVSARPVAELAQIAVVDDSVYVVWAEVRQSRYQIRFNSSHDQGATWLAADVQLDPQSTRGGSFPTIAASGEHVYVAWVDGLFTQSELIFNRSLDRGATWLSGGVRVPSTPAGTSRVGSPRLVAEGDRVYLVWLDWRGLFRTNSDVYFNRSLDAGTTWLATDVRLQTSASAPLSASHARLAAEGDRVYAVWSDPRDGSRDIYFNRSVDAGATWLSSDVRLDTSSVPGSQSSSSPVIAVDATGVYACWSNQRTSTMTDIRFNRSLDAGVTWLPSDQRLDRGAERHLASKPQLAASGSRVFATWSELRPPGNGTDIYYNRSFDRGTTWHGVDRRLDTGSPRGAESSSDVALACGDDAVYAVWLDRRAPRTGIYFNIPFGFGTYARGKFGSGGLVPAISGSGLAVIGQDVTVDVASGLGGTGGAMLIGGPGSKISAVVLGGFIVVNPALTVPIALDGAAGVAGAGSASLPLTLPPMPALVGAHINCQAALLDPGASFGVALTAGLELWIG
ncbi:MAG: hypothetical protein AAF628_36300 [Planctomycetota bacterium]